MFRLHVLLIRYVISYMKESCPSGLRHRTLDSRQRDLLACLNHFDEITHLSACSFTLPFTFGKVKGATVF